MSTVIERHAVHFKAERMKVLCQRRGLPFVPFTTLTPSIALILSLKASNKSRPIATVEPRKVEALRNASKRLHAEARIVPRNTSKRLMDWKWNKIISKFSRDAKSKKLVMLQKVARHHIWEKRRNVLQFFNLGNRLFITDDFLPCLEMDSNQSFQQTSCVPSLATDSFFTTLTTETLANHVALFKAANDLVESTFGSYDVQMNLEHTKNDNFTTDILFDKAKESVVAVAEYVFMQDFLWVESLVVDTNYRRKGVAKQMIHRLKEIAKERGKSLLLYSLFDSLPFYFKLGRFVLSTKFPFLEGHHGLFLEYSEASTQAT